MRVHCGHARFVWNLALEQANAWRPGRSSAPNSAQRFHQLAEARKDTWLGEGSSSVQQQALRDFDQALRVSTTTPVSHSCPPGCSRSQRRR